jgi:pyrimidine operon attenuation protein / uracil phosphoribosyltransferase
MSEPTRELLLDERAVERALARMAREIVERNQGVADLALIGVQRRGVQLANRLADEIERAESIRPPVGTLDITLYRDDLTTIGPRPVLGETRLPTGGIDERPLVIIDDVCYTGRTVRAALDELANFG